MDKDKMIEDIVAMLDGSVKKGDGHINVQVNEVEEDPKEIKEEKSVYITEFKEQEKELDNFDFDNTSYEVE